MPKLKQAGRFASPAGSLPQPHFVLLLALPLLGLAAYLALTQGSPLSTAVQAVDRVDGAGVAAAVELEAPAASAIEAWQPDGYQVERLSLVEPERWDALSRHTVEEALALLPPSVRADLGNATLGPLFILVNPDGMTLSGRQPYGRAANFYSTNEGRNEVVLYPGQSARTTLHELGHAYNLRRVAPGAYAQVMLDPEMQSFLAATGWRVLTPTETLHGLRDHAKVEVANDGPPVWTTLSRNDPLEDFASSFALYFAAPAELRELSAARHDWFAARFAR